MVTFQTVVRRPSALLPLAMSVTAFALVVGRIAIVGATAGADEGATAHLFQILIVAQVPLAVFFAATWLSRAPRSALRVLALQAAAVLVALAPVYCFHL
ncbi:MAG: hypothetical protein KGI40_11930 [Xanthomonadaceae bacterium]|nr:hypothetical protein [Xanthomonadaceae bacterium]MDE1959777.1 hypothetical protein [Xanthomonadaceae bacterium]MDE2176937.1 hypothetical protein [Xanthomonadaceae bacterium]MDE2246446.1 hypothetical protein [Xanthomonadaceae bacterium]